MGGSQVLRRKSEQETRVTQETSLRRALGAASQYRRRPMRTACGRRRRMRSAAPKRETRDGKSLVTVREFAELVRVPEKHARS